MIPLAMLVGALFGWLWFAGKFINDTLAHIEFASEPADDKAIREDLEVAELDAVFYAPDSEGNVYVPGA